MHHSMHTVQKPSGAVPASAYLKAPSPLPAAIRVTEESLQLKELQIRFLSALSHETDLALILAQKMPLQRTICEAVHQWFDPIYPDQLSAHFDPIITIYNTEFAEEEESYQKTETRLHITLSNEYIDWDSLIIQNEVELCEKIAPKNGIAVLDAIEALPFRHQFWTPGQIVDFVKSELWFGNETEQDYAEENDIALEDGDSVYSFGENDLDILKDWCDRKAASEAEQIQPVRNFTAQLASIQKETVTGRFYDTNFPEAILWDDKTGVIQNIMHEYEAWWQETDSFNFHAGGLKWSGSTVADFRRILKEIRLYLDEKTKIVSAIMQFKGEMAEWKKK